MWGYNAQLFYANEKELTSNQITEYMSWVPAVGGIVGAFLGELMADVIAKYGQPHYCLLVLALSQVYYSMLCNNLVMSVLIDIT